MRKNKRMLSTKDIVVVILVASCAVIIATIINKTKNPIENNSNYCPHCGYYLGGERND